MKHAKGETRQRLLETAKRLFMENGYVQTTVRQIAGEADLSTGTFYHFFRTKEELARVLCDTASDVYDLLEDLDEKIKDPAFHLEKYLCSYADFWLSLGWGLSSQLLLHTLPDMETVTAVQSVRVYIEAAQKAGTMNSRLAPKEASEYIFTNAIGILYKWVALNGNCDLKAMSEKFSPIILQGLL